MTKDLPTITGYSIETLSAWVGFHVVVATFILTLVTIFIAVLALYFTVRQNSSVKAAELEIKKIEIERERFRNGQFLLRILSTHEAGAFAELGALEALREYPEYHNVYRYFLVRYTDMVDESRKNNSTDLQLHLVYLELTKQLVEKTLPKK